MGKLSNPDVEGVNGKTHLRSPPRIKGNAQQNEEAQFAEENESWANTRIPRQPCQQKVLLRL